MTVRMGALSATTTLLAAVLLLMPAPGTSLKLEYDVYDMIPMGSYQNISLRLSFDEVVEEEENWPENQVAILTFNLTDKISWAVEVANESLVFDFQTIRRRKPVELTIKGEIIGVNDLEIYGHAASRRPFNSSDIDVPPTAPRVEDHDYELAEHFHLNSTARQLMRTTKLKVILKDQTLNRLFTLIMSLMIIVNTINMGGQLDLHVIKAVFGKPVGPIVGFVCQFLLMPLFSFGVGWLMSEDKLFRLGLFVLGCCPGGTGSNFWCILLSGDINLSITMTFVSTVAALGMMPMWLYLMGPLLTDGDLVIPYGQLIMTLIFLIAPISLGMWIRYRWEKAAPCMDKIIVPFTLVTILFIFTVGVYINLYVFLLITPKMVAAGFMVAGAGYFFGATMAWLFRLKKAQIIAVSIETAFQNGGIAFILLKVSMEMPYGEMACVAPVAQLVITGTPLWLTLFLWKGYLLARTGSCKTKEDEERAKEHIQHDKEDHEAHLHHHHEHHHDEHNAKEKEAEEEPFVGNNATENA